MGKQAPATGQVSGASYFGCGKRYLRPAGSQIPAGFHILDWKKSPCDRPGLRYMPGLSYILGGKKGTCDRPGLRYMTGFNIRLSLR